MKRIDVIAKGIFESAKNEGDLYVMKVDGGWGGGLIIFRPGIDLYSNVFGKMTIRTKSIKPQQKTIERLCLAEIKLRLRDSGWYKSGLRRCFSEGHYMRFRFQQCQFKFNV